VKTIFFCLLALSFQTAFAAVDFDPLQEILMTGENCQELEANAQSIIAWSAGITHAGYQMPECFCSAKSCRMDVTSISPYFVKQMTVYDNTGYGVSAAHSGPNCFNAALVASNTLNQIVFTHPAELDVILSSSLCTERKRGEALVPGDILVVRNQKDPNFDVHAGVYINSTLAFSKYGESPMMPYSYGFNVDKSYGVHDEECRRVEGTPKPGDTCFEKPYVNFFRCTESYSYVSGILHEPQGLNEAVREVYAEVSSFSFEISRLAAEGGKIEKPDLEKMQKQLSQIYGRSGALAADPTLPASNREFARLLHAHLFSLFEQTRRVAAELHWPELVDAKLALP
jgi:hypothetical protein